MATETSPAPWDLASGESWSIKSADHRIANDGNNERIVDAKGEVVAYVSGNDDGSNGALLAAAPALRDALRRLVGVLDWASVNVETSNMDAAMELAKAATQSRAALKKAGVL